ARALLALERQTGHGARDEPTADACQREQELHGSTHSSAMLPGPTFSMTLPGPGSGAALPDPVLAVGDASLDDHCHTFHARPPATAAPPTTNSTFAIVADRSALF